MLESLVSSRIRRTLLEHILAHPQDRFYLRGLAKTLSLTVSPLRRELKRLEHLGLLSAAEEGNMLFYTVNTGCPLFAQLEQAEHPEVMAQLSAAKPSVPAAVLAPVATAASQPQAIEAQDSVPVAASVLSAEQIDRMRAVMIRPMRWPMLVGIVGVGLFLMVMAVNMAYLAVTNQQLITLSRQAAKTREPVAAVTAAPAAASGLMSGARWRLVPGTIGGGFSAAATSTSKESY